MSDSIFTLYIEGETPQTFNSRHEAMSVVKELAVADPANMPEFRIKETSYCPECGEEKRWNSASYCSDCSFRLDPAVKASRKIIRALKQIDPVVSVWDGGETITGIERDLLEAVHSVDDSTLRTKSGAFIRIVGNHTEVDCVADYSMSLDPVLSQVTLRDE